MKRSPRCSPSMPASISRPANRRSAAATRTRPSCPTRPSRRATAGSASASPTTNYGNASAAPVERPELTDDPRFAKAADRVRNRDILVPIVKDIIRQRTRDEWLPLMDAAGIPSGAIRTVGEVCESDLLKSRDMIAEMPHAGKGVGVVKNIKNPMHLSDTPLDTLHRAAPARRTHPRDFDRPARLQRQRSRRTGAQRDDLTAHSITSSARASNVGGTIRPSALADLRLIDELEFGRLLHRNI